MYCVKCGTHNPEDVNFCTQCGAPISANSSGTATPARSNVGGRPSPSQWSTPVSATLLLNVMAVIVFILGFVGGILAVSSMDGAPGEAVAGTFIGVLFFSLFYSSFLVGLSAIASRKQ